MLKDLFEKKELIRIPVDLNKVKQSILTSEKKLDESKSLFNDEYFNPAILSAYTCIFHAARALLYQDGIQEKSHYAVIYYLREKYRKLISEKLLNEFENLKNLRKKILYGFEEFFNEQDAENAILGSEDFLEKIKRILSKNGQL